MKRRIQRALLNTQKVVRCPQDMQHNAVSVQLAHLREGLENQEVERPLEIVFGQGTVPLNNSGYLTQ